MSGWVNECVHACVHTCMYVYDCIFLLYLRTYMYRCLDWVTRHMNTTTYLVATLTRDWRSSEQRGSVSVVKVMMMASELYTFVCVKQLHRTPSVLCKNES